MNFAAVLEGVTLVAFAVVMFGGRQKREGGWKILAGLLGALGLLQCAGMAIVVSNTQMSGRWLGKAVLMFGIGLSL